MDELYSNLENYNEVNVVEELKNENEELKYKLEECSNAMNQLQTDFDKLSNEYKKLEVNYSSLLKTARAEIERKTLLITNLNKEKDMLVIKCMQSGGKNLNKFTQDVKKEVYNSNKKEMVTKEDDKEFPNGNKNKLGPIVETRDVSRVEVHSQSPIDSISSICTTNKSTSSDNFRNTSDKNSSDSKETILKNVLDQQHKDNKENPKKIMARRKSMPVLSNCEEHFSSEEEQVNYHVTNKRDLKRHQDYENKNNSDLGYGRIQKTSEQSRYESKNKYTSERYSDKYSPHVDSHRRSGQNPLTRYPSYRHSPERDRYKPLRHSYQSYRSDYRQRILKSPSDTYNRSKSRDRRHTERDYDNYNVKHSRNEYDSEERAYIKEPKPKRRRIESTSTDTEQYDRFVGKSILLHSEHSLNMDHDKYTSCQSPDYDQIESNITKHYVKEIKNTATIQLEDPRITSKKYLLNKSEEGSFITALAKTVCMKPINKSQWGIENVEVPEALKEKPSPVTLNDDLLNYIYMDIDDPTSNISTKGGSQKHSTDDELYINIASETPAQNKFHDDINVNKAHHDRDSLKVQHDPTSNTLSSNYKVLKKSNADSILPKERVIKNETNKYVRSFEKKPPVNSIRPLETLINEISSNIKLKNQLRRLTPIKDNVQEDLELSDEASDITDDIHIIDGNDNKLKMNVSMNDAQDNVVETCEEKDDHNNGTAKESENKTSKHVFDEDIPKKRKECNNETLKPVCEENNYKNVEKFQNSISNVENVEENKECDNNILKLKIPKKLDECKNKISKNKCEENNHKYVEKSQNSISNVENVDKTHEENKKCDNNILKLNIPKKIDECKNKISKNKCEVNNYKNVEEFQNLISNVENVDNISEENKECDNNILKLKIPKKLDECKNKISKNKCEENNHENVEEFRNLISNVDNVDKIPEENKECYNKILKFKIPKKIDECKKKISKNKCEENNYENVEEFQNLISNVENVDKIPEENKECDNNILKLKISKKLDECKNKISKNKYEVNNYKNVEDFQNLISNVENIDNITEANKKCDNNILKLKIPKKLDECKNKISKNKCEENNYENVEEFQNLISHVDNIDKIPEENKECDNKIVKLKIPKKIDECKKKISKNKCEEKTTEKLDECKILKTQSKDTRKREKNKKGFKGDTDKILQESEVLSEDLEKVTENELKGSNPKSKFTELFGESNSLITPDDLGICAKFNINNVQNDNYGPLFENTQDAIDLNVRDIQEIHNTEKNNSDVFLPSKVLSTNDNPQISYVINDKSVFEIGDKYSGENEFKNVKPASTDSELNIVKTVVISTGIQPCVEEKQIQQKNLQEIKSNNETECFANKPLGLFKAVATSTPNKMHYAIASRLTEISTPHGESLSKDTVSLSNSGHSTATSIDAAESNAPDVRIFVKRRRKIKKT